MCEELARINEPGFMIPLHSALCGPYIAEYGNAEQKARFMPGAEIMKEIISRLSPAVRSLQRLVGASLLAIDNKKRTP